MLKKSEFLKVLHQTLQFYVETFPSREIVEAAENAKVAAEKFKIFFTDDNHQEVRENPVIKAMLRLEVFPVFSMETVIALEEAWEFYESKTVQFIYLYHDDDGTLTLSQMTKGMSRPRIMVKAILIRD